MQRRQTPQYTFIQASDSLADIPYHLIARPGNELRIEPLKTIARLFMKIDLVAVSVNSNALQAVASGRLTTDPKTTNSLQQKIAEIAQINSAFVRIHEYTSEITKDYFEDRFFVRYWQQGLGAFKQILGATQGDESEDEHQRKMNYWMAQVREFVKVGLDIKAPLLNAASRGLLSDEILSGIGDRMDIIDDAAEYMHREHGDPAPGEKWPPVLEEILKARGENVNTPGPSPEKSEWTATLTALTGITTLCCFAPIYLAWSHSEYKRGSYKDADFWWLTQSSIMQMLSLLTLSVPIWQGSKLPSQNWFWTWFFVGIAIVATTLAVPLYLYIPVAYSSTLVFMATAAQAFVVLQLALAASIAIGRGGKEKTQ